MVPPHSWAVLASGRERRKVARIMRAMLFAALVAALTLAACGGPQWSPRTPAPLPSGATPLLLPTAPPAEPLRAGVEWGCADMLIGDVRVIRVESAVAFERVEGGGVDLVWPRGFSAWLRDGETEIVAPDGSVIARDGDVISERLIGVESGICHLDGVLYPPAS